MLSLCGAASVWRISFLLFSYRFFFEISLIVFVIKIRIGSQLCLRNRIVIVLRIHGLSVFHATFPLPQIIGIGKLAVADEVSTACTFHIKFAGTLSQYEVFSESGCCDVTVLAFVSSFAQSIDIS